MLARRRLILSILDTERDASLPVGAVDLGVASDAAAPVKNLDLNVAADAAVPVRILDLNVATDAAVPARDMALHDDASEPADLAWPNIAPAPCSTRPGSLPTTDAPAFRTDAAHTGAQPTDPIAAPLCLAWYFDLGAQISYPVVVGSVVFVSSGTTLAALNAATGTYIWGPVSLVAQSVLSYDQGRLYALTENGALRAFDASNGSDLWSVQLRGQFEFDPPPVALGGQVFVNGLESGGTTYAVDGASGAIDWTASTFDGSFGAPAVLGSVVFEAEACQQASAFDAKTGARLWYHSGSCTGGGGAAPAILDGRLYERDWVLGPIILDIVTGEALGTFVAGQPPALDGASGYFLGSALSSIDLTSGATNWSFTGDGHLLASPVTSQTEVFTASGAGLLYALDKVTGQVDWSADLGRAVTAYGEDSTMVIAAGTLFVPAGTRLFALRTAD